MLVVNVVVEFFFILVGFFVDVIFVVCGGIRLVGIVILEVMI